MARIRADDQGLGELLVAAPWATGAAGPVSGVVYVVEGPATITHLSGSAARLLGASPAGTLGESAAMAMGDLDGDGYDDVAVGAVTSTAGTDAGAVFAVYGPISGDVDLRGADFTLEGAPGERAGASVAIGGEAGEAALLVGVPFASASAPYGGGGRLFIGPRSGAWRTADADVWFVGDLEDMYGGMSAALAPLGGDGGADVVLGTPYDGTGAESGGGLFVFVATE